MTDFGTMAEELRVDLRKGTTDATDIKRKIVDSIRHWRDQQPFWFHYREFQFPTSAGVSRYTRENGIPAHMRIVEGDVWVLLDEDPKNRRRVRKRSLDYLQTMKETAVSDYPVYWSPAGSDAIGAGMEFWPEPSAVHTIIFEGRVDWLPPRKTYDATNKWKFSDDDFTNPWFTDGAPLTRNYAAFLMCAELWNDDAGAARHFARAMQAEEALRLVTEDMLLGERPDPWPDFGNEWEY